MLIRWPRTSALAMRVGLKAPRSVRHPVVERAIITLHNAYRTGDVGAMASLLHPSHLDGYVSPEWHAVGTASQAHSADELLEAIGAWVEEFEIGTRVVLVSEIGEQRWAIFLDQTWRGRASGVVLDQRPAQLIEMRDGFISRFHWYATWHEATDALDLPATLLTEAEAALGSVSG